MQVRRKGIKTICKTFATRTEARKWARDMERELDQGVYTDLSEAKRLTLGDIFNRYIREEEHKKIKSCSVIHFESI